MPILQCSNVKSTFHIQSTEVAFTVIEVYDDDLILSDTDLGDLWIDFSTTDEFVHTIIGPLVYFLRQNFSDECDWNYAYRLVNNWDEVDVYAIYYDFNDRKIFEVKRYGLYLQGDPALHIRIVDVKTLLFAS